MEQDFFAKGKQSPKIKNNISKYRNCFSVVFFVKILYNGTNKYKPISIYRYHRWYQGGPNGIFAKATTIFFIVIASWCKINLANISKNW